MTMLEEFQTGMHCTMLRRLKGSEEVRGRRTRAAQAASVAVEEAAAIMAAKSGRKDLESSSRKALAA